MAKNERDWDQNEIKFLEKNYLVMSKKEMSAWLNRTAKSISRKCSRLKLVKEKFIYIGKRFGRLTVIAESDRKTKSRNKYLVCQCDCGTVKEIACMGLRGGGTISCGCFRNENNRLEVGEASLNKLEYTTRTMALRRGIEYTLTTEQFRSTISMDCFYCGQKPRDFNMYYKSDGSKKQKYGRAEWADQQWVKANGIDRFDNSKGYTPENSVPCCWDCNVAKSDSAAEHFISHAERITNFQKNKIK